MLTTRRTVRGGRSEDRREFAMEMAWEPQSATPVLDDRAPGRPYDAGDELQVTAPDGSVYRAAVERVVPDDDDGFRVVAQVVSPRRFRDQVVVVRVDADGFGPHARPWTGETLLDAAEPAEL